MTARLRDDLRYAGCPSVTVRALYAMLHARRSELPRALEVLAPEAVLGAVLGCPPDEASQHLVTLRAAGLVGDGLTLLAGVPRTREPRTHDGGTPVTSTGADPLLVAVRASGLGASELARRTGLGRSSLAHFLAGSKGLGDGARATLAAALGVVTPVTVTATVTGHSHKVTPVTTENSQGNAVTGPVTSVTAPAAPSAPLASLPVSPSLSPSDSPSDPPNSPTTPDGARGSIESQPAEPQKPALRFLLDPQETKSPKAKRAPKAKPEPLPDPVPALGTVARRVYDAIVSDRVLGPITAGPGEFATRACAEGAYPGVDVLAEVRRAGEWLSAQPAGQYSDGRAFVRGWLKRTADRIARTPKAAPVGARVQGSIADLTARAMAAKAERERLAQAANAPQVAAGGSR